MAAAAIGGAVLGGIGGALKKGSSFELSQLGQQAQGYVGQSLGAYNNLVQAGPGAQDVTAATNAARGYANTLGNFASGGLYNMSAGNNLAQQQFAGQRTALEQTFQDQLAQANQQAALSGRGQNDPILKARLAQEQSRQSAQLNANQSSAAVDLGRQYSTDQIGLLGQQVSTLQNLGQQAFTNQGNLFNMSNSTLQSERNFGMQNAQYEQSRGGGFAGALNGILAGAGAGLQAGQGLQSMMNQTNMTNAQIGQMQQQSGLQAMPASANTLAMSGLQGGSSLGYSKPSGFSIQDMGYGGSLDSPAIAPQAQVVNYGANYGPPTSAAPGGMFEQGLRNAYQGISGWLSGFGSSSNQGSIYGYGK